MAYAGADGNLSTITYLNETLQINTPISILGISILLLFTLGWALRKNKTKTMGETLGQNSSDPFIVASFGLLITFALSPLVWTHYLVLLLLPGLYFLFSPESTRTGAALAGLFLLVSAGAERHIYQTTGMLTPDIVHASNVSSWVLLWAACVLFIRHKGCSRSPLNLS